jgi:hypothetical protein
VYKCLYCVLTYIPSYMSRSSIAGSYVSSIFSFVRSLYIVFHSNCTNLHPYQQYMRVPLSLHPHQHLLLFVFLMVVIWTGVRWNLDTVLICISFNVRDVENVFIRFWPFGCLWKISISVHLPVSSLGRWFFGQF